MNLIVKGLFHHIQLSNTIHQNPSQNIVLILQSESEPRKGKLQVTCKTLVIGGVSTTIFQNGLEPAWRLLWTSLFVLWQMTHTWHKLAPKDLDLCRLGLTNECRYPLGYGTVSAERGRPGKSMVLRPGNSCKNCQHYRPTSYQGTDLYSKSLTTEAAAVLTNTFILQEKH